MSNVSLKSTILVNNVKGFPEIQDILWTTTTCIYIYKRWPPFEILLKYRRNDVKKSFHIFKGLHRLNDNSVISHFCCWLENSFLTVQNHGRSIKEFAAATVRWLHGIMENESYIGINADELHM